LVSDSWLSHPHEPRSLLLDSNPNATTSKGRTALSLAEESGFVECIEALAPVTKQNGNFRTFDRNNGRGKVFLRAAAGGYSAEISKYLSKDTRRSDDHSAPFGCSVDAYGRDALMLAAEAGNATCVEILIPISDPTARDKYRNTALIIAAYAGNASCVERLLSVSHLDAKNQGGDNALMVAAANGQANVLSMFYLKADRTS
jgi:ankyrin repeat protein